ncbi:hypothetical protein GCM10023231_01070 [Olivibacter ginsenosidimutans]|uniref:RHS repeat protein n=1 Tax=Olivibacter ginsenosidimutans TaxID=1176537 RepID=A0ABP9ACZ6_9SPHI
MREIKILVFLVLLVSLVKGQDMQPLNPTLSQVIGPSPNASALTKFGNIPVGPSTGIPEINIPIYSYNNSSNNLQLSISLDYHAGGVKLEEIASSVGLGWALNAGGVITRVVRGIYDEEPAYGFLNDSPLPKDEDEGNSPLDVSFRPFNKIYAGVRDGQSDIFIFNFCGKSGKFMFGKNGDFLMLKQGKLKVTKKIGRLKNRDMITEFTIVDEKGFTYIFGAPEVTTTLGSVWTGSSTFSSSWYLTQIIDPTGTNKITLQYDAYGIGNYSVGSSESRFQAFAGPAKELSGSSSSSFAQNIEAQRLRKISFPNGVSADFLYDEAERSDLPGDRLLKKITVKDGFNKIGYELKQDYSLNRATLKEVIALSGINEVKDRPYEMFYYTSYGVFPNRNTEKPDHWGYYKGKGVGSWIPREIFPFGIGLQQVEGGSVRPMYELPGSNRNTDPNYMKTGSLIKMNYPTGGYTTFDMEANQAVDDWLNQEFTITIPNPPYIERSASCYVNSSDPYKSDYRDITYNGENNTVTTFKITLSSGHHPDCYGNCSVTAEFYDSTNPSTMHIMASGTVPFSSNGASTSFSVSNLIKGKSYRIVMYANGMDNFAANIGISWREKGEEGSSTQTYSNKQPYVGGLRVAAIQDYDGVSQNPVRSREFEYTLDDGNTSSGTLGVYPIYSFQVFYDYIDWNAIPNYIHSSPNYIIRNSSTNIDLINVNGSPVTYSRVVEKITNNGITNGKIVRYFTSFDEYVPRINAFPFTPADYSDWHYGLLKEEQLYDSKNTLVSKTVNQYDMVQDGYWRDENRYNNFRSISVAPVVFFDANQKINPRGEPKYFVMREFSPRAGRADLVKSTTTTYDGGSGVTVIRGYGYDQDNYLLKYDTLTNSAGIREMKRYQYAFDMVKEGNDPNGIYSGMLSKNMINYKLHEVTKNSSKSNDLYSIKVNYFKPLSASDFYAPQTITTNKLNAREEVRVRHHAYDKQGNILTSSLEDGTLISYLWSYNGQYPVAEVKNAGQSEIAYAGFEAEGKGNWSYSGATVGDDTAPAGRKVYSLGGGNLSKVGLSTAKRYVLSYWAKSATATGISGGTATALGSRNGWTLYRRTVTGVSAVSLTGSVYVDEVRIYPESAQITTYTYDPLVGMTSSTDASGRTTYYEYDGFGRLQQVKDTQGKPISSYDYHYQNQ